jgi:colicin import membrane protein
MQASADSLAFAPPPEPAAVRGFALAVIAHLLLLLALTWGINWHDTDRSVAVEAELWSAIPQEAAPPAPKPPPPQPEVKPEPPKSEVQPAPPPPVVKTPDINVERDKQRKEEERRRKLEEEEQQRKQQAEERKREEQQRLAEEKKQKEELAKKEKLRKQLEAKKLEQLRKEALNKMMAEAEKAGSGAPNSRGNAAKSSGPSEGWGARIRARVRPNIQIAGDVVGNPQAEVEVRLAPDGTIVGTKLVKSSGDPVWDRAVMRALDLTGVFPRDVDGRVHTPVTLAFSRHGD